MTWLSNPVVIAIVEHFKMLATFDDETLSGGIFKPCCEAGRHREGETGREYFGNQEGGQHLNVVVETAGARFLLHSGGPW